MEGGGGGGSSAAGGGGGGVGSGVLGAAREEKERGGGGAMGRARVRARVRAPHGAGALLIVGGAIIGAAVFHWFRRHRDGGEGEGAKNHGVQHAKEEEEVSDGGVVEDEQGEAQMLHQIYENLSKDKIEVRVDGTDGKATEELHQIQKDDEIVPAELVSEPVEKYDHNSDRDCAKIAADAMVTESVTEDDKYDHNSETDCAETTADGMVTESVTEDDDNSSKNCIEEDEENSRENTVKNENIVNDTEGAQNSDESTLSLSSPDITIEEHDNHNGAAQDAEPTEAIPMTENVTTHQEQFSEEVNLDTVAETAEVEGTVMEKNEFEQEEEKAKGELVELVSLPAYSSVPSLIKRTEKKSLVNPGWNERGMKLEQDFTDGVLKEHELTKGGAVLTMDRSTSYVAILALMFAVAIGITIFIRLSVPLQAT
ncbi:hypothetical protein ABZP36_010333 [Zizania latifolia]